MPNRLNTSSSNNLDMEETQCPACEENPTCEKCGEKHLGDTEGCNTRKIKRHLMSEFSVLYTQDHPSNFSMIEQISDEIIHVSLKQYPDQGEIHEIKIWESLNRLRFFGWQLRWIKYDKNSTLHLYFEKVDWRAREAYGLIPTKYNNETELWWLDSNEPERKEGCL